MHEWIAGLEFIARGGFMMYPLLIAAGIALTVIIERGYVFSRRYRVSADFVARILAHVRKGELSSSAQECESVVSPISAVLATGIKNLSYPAEELELAMKNEAERWVPQLEKRIEILDTVITAAPLMGLLGTITGMMASFQVLSQKGVNEPNAITGGVAEALIATATGLVIALFSLIAYNYLSTRVKRFIYEMESAASQLLEIKRFEHREKASS